MTKEVLDGYGTNGLFSAGVRQACRAPGHEEVPLPEPYEAVVFQDFFSARLCFPCEGFLCEVLERFNLQLHQLTPNTFSRLGIFVMSLKMAGCEPNVDTFARHYECQLKEKTVIEKRMKVERRLEFGSYNFVPRKKQVTVSIVPAYHNKWSQWPKFWFYIRVCTDEEVTASLENGLPKASVLVSEMIPMDEVQLADVFYDDLGDADAVEAFASTSRWQISRDLVEEWVSLNKWPLSSETNFAQFRVMGGYRGTILDCRRPDGFSCNFDYVRFVEDEASKAIGPYGAKEHEAKCQSLHGVRCLNRAFDAMGLIYANRMDLSPRASEGEEDAG